MSRSAIVPFRLPSHIAGNKPVQGRALIYWITPGYAEVLGLRLREGRFFVDADARAGRLATIVNQEFVRKHLSTSHVTGLTIPGLVGEERGTTSEIIGVVGDVLKDGNDRAPQPELYFVHGSPGQRIAGQVNLVVRTIGDPDALAPLLGRLVRQIESGAVVDPIEPLTTAVATSVAQPRFAATVVVAFASLAMILAAVGLYGVLSYSVSQRHRELGIRAALGAGRADLVRLVLREGLTVTLVGVALGLVAAMGLTRLLQ
jgi:putative ABC transport system permease protein